MLSLRAVQVAYEELRRALSAALSARGVGAEAAEQLAPTEPPRAWGLTTNVCFGLGGKLAEAAIAEQGAGLDKKAAKQLAARLSREAAEKLAAEIAGELEKLVGQAASLPGSGGVSPPDEDGRRDAAPTGNQSDTSIASTKLPFIARVESEGAYINFYYDEQALSAHVVDLALGSLPAWGQASPPAQAAQAVTPVPTRVEGLELSNPRLYGHGAPSGRQIMVEYAQPNTHKDFHVGHLRNAAIGQAIANLLEFSGHTVFKATYIGDVGAHVAKAIWGHHNRENSDYFQYFANANTLAKDTDRLTYWGACYQGANALMRHMQAVEEQTHPEEKVIAGPLVQSRQWLSRWEFKAPETRAEWLISRDECDKVFKRIFAELLVEFDEEYYFYESTVDDSKLDQKTAEGLKQLGIATVDYSEKYKGALYVDFELHAEQFPEERRKRVKQLGKMTILRSDGTSLYQTKELGLAKYKFDLIREKTGRALDESLYVVGAEQKLYFEQVFAILHLWGFPNADNCKHISYELVVLPEGKMSSREGTVVSYRELRDEALRRAEAITRDKGIGASNGGEIDEEKVKDIARKIAIAAIKYTMLQVGGNMQIVFDFEQALSFDGRAAPYLQYAYARAGKLVDHGGRPSLAADEPRAETPALQESLAGTRALQAPGYTLHASEVALAQQIGDFPEVCADAAARYEPAALCNYLYELASAFSDFYRDCRVLDAPEAERAFRQRLCAAFRVVLRTGFAILALPLPEEM